MTAPNNTINDASVVYGSRQLTINTVVFETSDFKLDFDIKRIVRTNSLGIPSGKVVLQGEQTGSATLHLATSTTARPLFGQSFTTTVDGVTATFTIEKVGTSSTSEGETMTPVTFSMNIGTVVVSSN